MEGAADKNSGWRGLLIGAVEGATDRNSGGRALLIGTMKGNTSRAVPQYINWTSPMYRCNFWQRLVCHVTNTCHVTSTRALTPTGSKHESK